MADVRIRILVDPTEAKRGRREVNRELDQVENRADKLRQTLRRTFQFLTIGLAVREIHRLSESFTTIQNRLRTVVDDQEQVNVTFNDLIGIANRTRTEVDAIAALYQRGSIAAKELGASNEQLLTFVERVGQGLAVQGGSAASASGALTQLSQALGSGIVRAEEFNSILEGAFPIAQAAARGIDRAAGSVARLRQLIVAGEVTSREFFEGFLQGSKELEDQFNRTVPTISQAFTVLRNSLVQFIGQTDSSIGASATLAQGIILLAQNLESLANTLLAVGAIAAAGALAKLAGQATSAVKGFSELRKVVASGNFVLLGSAEAEAMRANAIIASTQAEIAATRVTIARNAELGVSSALQAQLAKQEAALATAQTALNAQTAAAAVKVGAMGKAWRFLTGTVVGTTGTLVAAGVTFFAVNKILEVQENLIKDIDDAYKNLEEDSTFPKLGTQIRQLQQDLRRLDDISKAQGGFLSDSQQARRTQIVESLTRVRKAARDLQEQQARIDEARRREASTLDNLLLKLDEQAKALRLVGREATVQAAIQSSINKLLKENQRFDEAEARKQIESRVRNNLALRDQQEILERLRGPGENLRRQLKAINDLHNIGRISTKEWSSEMARLREEFDKTADDDPFSNQVQSLTAANALLQEQIEKGRLAADVRSAILDIEREIKGTLGDDQKKRIEEEFKKNELLSEQARLLEEIIGPQRQYEISQEALNQLMNAGKISADQYKQALAGIREELGKKDEVSPFEREILSLQKTIRLLEIRNEKGAVVAEAEQIRARLISEGATNEQIDLQEIIALLERRNALRAQQNQPDLSFGAGVEKGLQRLRNEADNLAAAGERVVNVFADTATDAITKFVETGKFSFRDFATSILEELKRIIIRMLVVRALSAALGIPPQLAAPLAGAGQQAFNRGAADGANVQPGQRPRIIGERGPEVFNPNQTGQIQPIAQGGGDRPVNIMVVVVKDEDEAQQKLASGQYDQILVTRMSANKSSSRQALGIG